MSNIITVTLNPAFDIHCNMKSFVPFSENYVESSFSFVGGKGINISRALSSQNIDNLALVVLGKENAASFEEGLKAEGINYRGVYTGGRIRENFTLHCENQKETRLSFDSFKAQDSLLDNILEFIPTSTKFLAFSGRLPLGITKSKVIKFLKEIKNRDIFLAVDCNSFSLEELIEICPDFIKPNEVEIGRLSDKPIKEVAAKLYSKGIKHVLITRGNDSSVYAGKNIIKEIKIPVLSPVSTVGAGDCTVAGFLAAYSKGQDIDTCLKTAIAFGSAACLKEGTSAPDKTVIEEFIKQTEIINI